MSGVARVARSTGARGGRRFGAIAGALSLALFAAVVAQPSVASAKAATTHLTIHAAAVFKQLAARGAYGEIVVSITNDDDVRREGRVLVMEDARDSAKAAFKLDPHTTTWIHLPVIADPARVRVECDGMDPWRDDLHAAREDTIRVADLEESARLFRLNGAALHNRLGSSTFHDLTIEVASPQVDAASGDLVLPRFTVGYRSVDLVYIESDRLNRLDGVELEALSAFVLGGGTLAVLPAQDEDFRGANLSALLGGVAVRGAVSPLELEHVVLEDPLAPLPQPFSTFPESPVSVELSGFVGGNLEPDPAGAAAAYGLGRVVVLGMDLRAPQALDDTWVRVRLADLIRRAFETRATSVGVPADRVLSGDRNPSPYSMHQLLNPQPTGSWGIGVSAVLLCIYAIIAGPVAFSRARAKNRPFAALKFLPIASAVMFLIILGIGFIGKRGGLRARRLTFVDLGAGMDRGVGVRYRAATNDAAMTMEFAPDHQVNIVRRDTGGGSGDDAGIIVGDAKGAFLAGVNAGPTELIATQELGVVNVGSGLSVTLAPKGVHLHNRTGRELRTVFVKLPDDSVQIFDRIGPDGTVDVDASARGDSTPTSLVYDPSSSWGHKISRSGFLTNLSDRSDKGGRAAWDALLDALGTDHDWFPSRVPVVLAYFDEPEGRPNTDGTTDFDRVLVRVVGFGGEP